MHEYEHLVSAVTNLFASISLQVRLLSITPDSRTNAPRSDRDPAVSARHNEVDPTIRENQASENGLDAVFGGRDGVWRSRHVDRERRVQGFD